MCAACCVVQIRVSMVAVWYLQCFFPPSSKRSSKTDKNCASPEGPWEEDMIPAGNFGFQILNSSEFTCCQNMFWTFVNEILFYLNIGIKIFCL
jgi:hypothetical protein